MANRERRKGRDGEAEMRHLYESYGFEVRGLEGAGDHLVLGQGLVLHSETKRCETARPWAWMAQAEAEHPVGAIPIVAFRRSRSRWYVILAADSFLDLIAGPGGTEVYTDD